MALIPWNNKSQETGRELAPLDQLRGEMHRLFDNFFAEPFAWPFAGGEDGGTWAPTLDVAESDKELTVRAELPGVDPRDIDVSVTGERLVLSGEKKESQEKQERNVHRRETRYGSFRREVALPRGIDPQKVAADYANGVLTVRLAKSPDVAPCKIKVKAATEK